MDRVDRRHGRYRHDQQPPRSALRRFARKIIVGLKIGSDSGVHASSGQLWGRWAIKNCYTVFLVIGTLLHLPAAQSVAHIVGLVVFIGFFFIFGENRQGFHDMIAHTAVYRRSELV